MTPQVLPDIAGDDLLGLALDTLPSNIAILDTDGRILVTNSSWREFAQANDSQMVPTSVGVNYLDITEMADDRYADRAADGIHAVLRGEREQFELEYPSHSPAEKRWFMLRVAPFIHDGDRYATVSHIDITDRWKRERALRDAYEISVSDRPFPQKVDALLKLGREVLDLTFGTLSHVQGETYTFEAVAAPSDTDITEGKTVPLETLPNCKRVVETEETLVLRNVATEAPELLDSEWGITAYLGAPVVVDGEVYGTFCFYSTEARNVEFSDWETTFVELLSTWMSTALERRHYTDLLGALETTFPDLAFLIDADGTYRDYHTGPAMRDCLVTSPDELLNQTLHDIMPRDTADELLATVRQALDTGDLQTIEYELDVPAGTRWFEARVTPFAHGVYGPDTVVFIARDITERKEREQDFHATSEMLRTVQRTMASPASFSEKLEEVLAFGRDYLNVEHGFFAHINNDTIEIRVASGPNDQLQVGASVPMAETYCRHAINEDAPDLRVLKHASEEGWLGDPAFERFGLDCYVGTTVAVDEELYGTICFVDCAPAEQDFTEQQRMFVELLSEWVNYELTRREREQQYQHLTERITDAYYALNTDWTVTYWNSTVAERIGVPAADIIGTTLWGQFPEIEGTVYEETLRAAMQSQDPKSCEFYYENGDYWIKVDAYPDEEGISVISKEITERKQQERELAQQHDELAQLNRVNTIVRELIQALQNTETREEIETAVCDRLTDSALYQSAWIGVRGATMTGDQTVIPQTTAGIGTTYLDTNPDFEGPAMTAVRTGEIQIVDDIATAEEFPEARRVQTPDHEHHALAAVPLMTSEVTYGVLVVYAPADHTLTTQERAILTDLGHMVAQAIQRVNSQQALTADTVVTVDFHHPDTDLVLGDVSMACDCELTLEQWVSTAEEGALYYFSVHGADPACVCDYLRDTPLDGDYTVVRKEGEDRPPLIELRLATQPNLPTDVLHSYGGMMTSARFTDGDLYFGVELPPSVDIRTVVDALCEVVPSLELVRKQSVDRPTETERALQNQISAQLTPKQEAALEAAYARGYYEWPRNTTMEELAEAFDITSASLHYRLRRAHQTIVETVVEGT